jgi:hypothetical protein
MLWRYDTHYYKRCVEIKERTRVDNREDEDGGDGNER